MFNLAASFSRDKKSMYTTIYDDDADLSDSKNYIFNIFAR